MNVKGGPVHPKIGKLIRVHGWDWSEFSCIGKFVIDHKNNAIFNRRLPNGSFEKKKDDWLYATKWEYVEEDAKP